MHIETIKQLLPLPILFHAIQKRRLKNKDITILCNNCLGGVVYHCLGMKFLSPTVNLMVDSTAAFLKLCQNLDYYLSQPVIELKDDSVPYPCGMVGDIKLHFNHYHTFEDAVSKWESRKKRINKDNIYIIANDYISDSEFVSRELILEFGKLKCKNLIMFTSVPHDDVPFVYYLGLDKLKSIMFTSKLTGLRSFEWYWDYVKFLNSERTK